MPLILYPERVTKENTMEVGGKASNLGELINAGFPVPECFFITTEAYYKFLEENELKEKILKIINNIDFSDVNSLNKRTEEIRSLILNARMPLIIREAILKAYKKLMIGGEYPIEALEFIKAGRDYPFVAVRSSATIEDISKASSAGQYETFLNVRGENNLISSVQKCWASLYTARATYYRWKNNQSQDAAICVIVQRMINSEKSGVSFTVDPARPKEGFNKIIIEACWGLGETIVQGQVEPDFYVVDKNTGKILEKKIGKKNLQRIKDPYSGLTIKQYVPEEKINIQVLTDNEIITLAAFSKKIEQHYKYPQDIEWAIERGKIYIVQTRAVTILEEKIEEVTPTGEVILRGLGASPGFATGIVKIIHDISELNKIEKGDVLVTKMTSPDFVISMEKSVAIVTDEGGTTSHASIVSRELGIPCIVGTKEATKILKDGMKITVNASKGEIYSGVKEVEAIPTKPIPEYKGLLVTELKVNLAFPETAKPEIAEKTDGVGLLRVEHMLTSAGLHPMEYIREGLQDELVKILVEGIGKVAKIFHPKPVWVRTLDARTDEFRHMKGGENEPEESNPMLGWHGIRRSLDEPEILRVEFSAVKELHEQGLDNVEIMLPFVIDVSELKKAKEIAKQFGIKKIGIMVETPAAALTIEDFCKEGISFISFGSNDLTQLTLGVDRNNERLAKLFNEMHPSMRNLFEYVIKICKQYNVKTSICGELPSNNYEAVEFLIKTGIDSLSVNIDAIDKVKNWAAKIEKKILLEKTRE